MTTNQLTNAGYIVGRISYSATSHLSGSMVVASDGINGYSTISDKNGYFSIYNVPAGVYDVTVTDNNGCTTTNMVIITEPDEIITTSSTVNVTCFGLEDGLAVEEQRHVIAVAQ